MKMRGVATHALGLAKFIQAFLIGLSLLVGLNAAGLDLTTLTVLTGAIGIGLGFGLQAIASNFVSGFVLLMDRSIKPGDVISLSGIGGNAPAGPGGTLEHFGWVQELRGRYVWCAIAMGGALVPNQILTHPIINGFTGSAYRLPCRFYYYKSDPIGA